jgi:hypothetical protein
LPTCSGRSPFILVASLKVLNRPTFPLDFARHDLSHSASDCGATRCDFRHNPSELVNQLTIGSAWCRSR